MNNIQQLSINKLQGVGDSVLQAILDDDSEKLLELISDYLTDTTIFFLPNISKKLPEFLSSNPSLLSLSSFFASTNCFRLLLSLNSNADAEDNEGRTSIHFAAAGGSLDILRELDQHLRIAENGDGNTPLQNSSENPFLRSLLGHNRISSENGVYNYPDFSNKTPIHYAAQFGRLDIIKYLYLKGADLDLLRDKEGRRPIHLACLYGHVDVARFFVENGVSLTDENSMHSIHYACIGGDAATIEYLISQKVDPNVMYCSNTPICYAAKYGSLNAIKVLLKHKAIFKIRGRKNTPIHEAALNGHLDVVRFFIEQGCDPNVYDSTGQSILYSSLKGQHYDITKYLLSRGATVFPDGRYEKNTNTQSLTEQQTSKSKHKYLDPILFISTRNEEMLLMLLNRINIEEYLNDDSSSDPHCSSPDIRKRSLRNSLISFESPELIDFGIECKILDGDCTDIYNTLFSMENCLHLISSALDKGLSFDPNSSDLANDVVKYSDFSLFMKFLDSGLQLSPSAMPHLMTEAILAYQLDIVKYFLESKLILPNNDPTDLFHEDSFAPFVGHSYINFILIHSVSIQFGLSFPTLSNNKDQSESLPISTNPDKLMAICKLFLDYGFTFSSNDPPFHIMRSIKSEQCKFLFQLLTMIDEVCPKSLDFSKYPVKAIEGLLFAFNEDITQKCLSFYLKHSFSFHSKDGKHHYDDLPLFSYAIYGRTAPFNMKSLNDQHSKGATFQNQNEDMSNESSSSTKGSFPDLKLIYYLFDHEYVFSPHSLLLIVKFGINNDNQELVQKASRHCALYKANLPRDQLPDDNSKLS